MAQLLHPTDNPIAVTVSFLVFGSYGWLQTSAFYILGISFIALAIALVLKINAKINLGAIVVFLVGVAFLLVASNHVLDSEGAGLASPVHEVARRDSHVLAVAAGRD